MVCFRVLGAVGVLDAEGEQVEVPGELRRVMLAMLLLNGGKVVPREQLAEEMWPDGTPEHGVNALQAHVVRLRHDLDRLLGVGQGKRRIGTNRFGYSLRVESGELDLDVFDSLCAESRELSESDPATASDMLLRALELWRGPALADVRERSPRLYAAAVRAEEHHTLVLEEFISLNIRMGNYDGVIGRLKALTARYPHRERLFEQLITALGRTGRKVEAANVFRRLRAELVAEFGVEPSPTLSRRVQEALDQGSGDS
ncbi:DNA-binding SARP family transcriptional activator [Actinopolyspora biskrensis]|uniref:DNA-binding SARP family transcriptional activator n=1 Tax=Actinopolyspora biskrensis TaxID=1470178 RepID=A0A852YT57_9ACTN|nr:AfsR/SARP family transcriptional regulator [Actinopolyspora biskrensis]NYH76902.1 DNA-binding SARP family transcriptional activator [Actinopolyspora biskrensis]